MENCRLYVGNLSDDVSEGDLRERFREFGDVSTVQLATDRMSGRMRGHGFVTMTRAADAHTAMTRLDGAVLQGRALRVSLAGEPDSRSTAKAVARARITSQLRSRLGMEYELDCIGVHVLIRMSPEDAREQAWLVEASVKRAAPAEPGPVEASTAPTRAAALDVIARSWTDPGTAASGRPALDWSAIAEALAAVRAI
jgi:hypothetical protein